MKKILISLCLVLSTITVFAQKDCGVNIPEWKDFAPSAFVDIKEPTKLGRFNSTAKYWYERKVDFETQLAACLALEANDERFSCYENLKVEQYKMNNDYNARLEAKMNGTSSIPGMENRTDNMIPIGNYLNNAIRWMPNEVR